MTSQTTTLLFTDIEGSTRLWEREGQKMSQALAEHDALSRRAVENHRGIIIKMTGDGMYAAFADALDALNATAALQRSMERLAAGNEVALRVRAGLHSGVVERRDEDLFGSAVNRAARIMKAAHGGQILVSQAVADQVSNRLPALTSLRDLGVVRLRDLATGEHVYQLVHPDLRSDFPALRSLEAIPSNLPQQVTSFIGRAREVAEAKHLLGSTRLLTLIGMGGLGKTRLALQVSADVLEEYADGVWFVDLAPLRDESLVPNAAAQALGLREEAGKPVTQTLCEHLKGHKALLILDNCEHLIDACASFGDSLLGAAPNVRILATSREPLRIRGEQTYAVLPLPIPARGSDVEAVLRSEAVQLFVERAQLQKPGFSLKQDDAPAVAELCARLDGIPLALELAAARLRSLSLLEINARLKDRFKLLTAGSRVALPRQQTLRALVEWSYDLLRPEEQITLDRMSVFSGGFDMPAAEVVCGGDPIGTEDVIDLVTSLVDKSLVMVEQDDHGSRYGLLETIREFAHERLSSRYEMLATIREFATERLKARDDVAVTAARHCHHYFSVARKAGVEKLTGDEQAECMRRLERDLDNFRSAIAFALAGGVDPVMAVKIEVALMRFRWLRGFSTEGRNNIRAALVLPALQGPTVARAFALYTGGALAMNQSEHEEARAMLTEALAIRRELGQRMEVAGVSSTLATLHLQMGDIAKARKYQEESLAIFRELGNELGEAIGLRNLGEISMRQNDDGDARRLFEQCLMLARRMKHEELQSECERSLGELDLSVGNLDAARKRFERSLTLCRDAHDKRGEAITRWRLGVADQARGELESARDGLTDAVRALQSFGMNAELLDCLEDYAGLLQRIGQTEGAVQLLSATGAARARLNLSRTVPMERASTTPLEAMRIALGEAGYQAAWSTGSKLSVEEATRLAVTVGAAKAVAA